MSNKHASQKHGMCMANVFRPKSSLSKRRNKKLARERKTELWEKIKAKKETLEKQLEA